MGETAKKSVFRALPGLTGRLKLRAATTAVNEEHRFLILGTIRNFLREKTSVHVSRLKE